MDSDSEDEAEVVLEYVGGRDAAGRYHGRATVRYASGDVFRGRFAHGERLGRGATEFEDGSVQSGRYVGDALEGEALYAYPSGESIACNYRMGVMEGPYEEREACGRVCCAGTMVDGQRSGRVEFSYRDGGRLRGTVAEDGSVSGSDFVYSYPDGSCLAGEWRDGEMASAVFRSRSAAMMLGSDAGLPSAKRARTAPPTFSHDPGTATRISRQPMLADPFESLRVEARASRLPNAGEGLFARRALAEGEVAAFYAGVRLSHEVVDGRGWEENDNTLSIDDDTVIDVPPPFASITKYRATLGHKANHSFAPNARYELYNHPRFGEIKCIRTTRRVPAGEEVTVHYDYNEVGEDGRLVAPAWFLAMEGSDVIGR